MAGQIVNALVRQKKLIWSISKGSKGINFRKAKDGIESDLKLGKKGNPWICGAVNE